ncbi:DDE-type integrase/transposase/recombinase [Flavobacterium sp. CSZ]|uniref:DDE-type integrase/transposase/recombinase n=1 Tax=Flavobacterium sp. CSZ TaxID=2783791 RepID=UPI00188AA037|nr:DDE-type integrase/transposase/recombinase [Flavobacterium sp. CSZ]MBF4486322.1 IS6 family transposase [Flavobacterium sp. CSZ]
MRIREVIVDHATIQRWVYKCAPLIEAEIKKRKDRVGASWRLDETYIKVKGIWCYLYRAVDKLGNMFDFLFTRERHRISPCSFLIKAISNNSQPRVINILNVGKIAELKALVIEKKS